ncbi:MAG: hypothetical protein AB7S26_18970 [Sandaracinaceae bacterium]
MSAARKRQTQDFIDAIRLDAYTGEGLGVRTRLIQEALEQILSPAMRDQVMAQAGWDDGRDAPLDPNLSCQQWVDTKLFVRLVDKTTLTSADELRRHLRALLERTEPPPAPASVADSGIRRRRPTPPHQTVIPRPSGSTVLLWTPDTRTVSHARRAFGQRAELVVVADALEMISTLNALEGRVSLVMIDRREGDPEDLRVLSPEDLHGHQVLVWGPTNLTTPTYARILSEVDRVVGCTKEASLADVVDLSAAILGVG